MIFFVFRHMPRKHILVAAPHFRRPAVNGADILIQGRWGAVARKCFEVTIVGEREVLHYSEAGLAVDVYENRNRSRVVAGARTVARRSHYFAEKFWTPAFSEQLAAQLAARPESIVVASFPAIGALIRKTHLRQDRRALWIESHNYEPEWFGNFLGPSSSIAVRLAAKSSLRWLERELPSLLDQEHFLHVSSRDQSRYSEIRSHRSLVAPVGTELPAFEFVGERRPDEKMRLVFLGSLSVKMNVDALEFFAEKFFPILNKRLQGSLVVQVVGSAPSTLVTQLCQKHGWSLRADVSEEELSEILQCGDLLIMPFAYSAGSKLKIVKALAHGLPILGTTCLGSELTELPFPCFASDDPYQWLSHVERVLSEGTTAQQARDLRYRAEMYSWDAIADELRDKLVT